MTTCEETGAIQNKNAHYKCQHVNTFDFTTLPIEQVCTKNNWYQEVGKSDIFGHSLIQAVQCVYSKPCFGQESLEK